MKSAWTTPCAVTSHLRHILLQSDFPLAFSYFACQYVLITENGWTPCHLPDLIYRFLKFYHLMLILYETVTKQKQARDQTSNILLFQGQV